jgi:excisionase family DNA binding protein
MPRLGTKQQQETFDLPPRAPRKRGTKRDVADEYKVSIRTVDTWIAQKKIPFFKLGSRLVRFDLDAVAKALERYKVEEVK